MSALGMSAATPTELRGSPAAQPASTVERKCYAIVIAALHGGGAERVAATLATEWSSMGHVTAVLTTMRKAPSAPPDYPVPEAVRRLRLDGAVEGRSTWERLGALFTLVRALRKQLRGLRGWHVISFGDVTNTLVLLAATGLGLRVTVCERTDPGTLPNLARPFVLLRRWLYPRARHVVAQTPSAAAWLRRECRRDAIVLPNPLSLPFREFRPDVREPWIIAVGRLDRLKGVDTVIRAFATVRARHPGWRLGVIGRGPEAESLLALARELGVDSDVRFVGHVDDMRAWYGRASILAHGSRQEGFPNVLLEAMAAGLPVVATDCPSGPSDLIEDGRNGFLVPVDDVPAMAGHLGHLMVDAGLREQLAAAAVQVREDFEARAVAVRWADALD